MRSDSCPSVSASLYSANSRRTSSTFSSQASHLHEGSEMCCQATAYRLSPGRDVKVMVIGA